MTPAFDPILPWPVVAVLAALIVALTLLAYRTRLGSAQGRWPWIAVGLRLAALALVVFAATRPALLVLRKIKPSATVVFLTDTSSSMNLGGEAGGLTRIAAARRTLDEAIQTLESIGTDLTARSLAFDAEVREASPDQLTDAKGRLTAIGTALDEALKRYAASNILRVVLLSDGASNAGPDPTLIAETLGNQGIPIIAVGFGSEAAGPENRDIAVRDLEAGPIVYAKTQLEVFAKLDVRGFPGRTLQAELRVEGQAEPVARASLKVPDRGTELNLRGLKWTPQNPGETKITLSVKPLDGELLASNNESSTFVTVLKGGISVLYLAGQGSPWERKFAARAVRSSEKIQLDEIVLFEPAGPELDAELQPGKYDVFILGDLPAHFLSSAQKRLIADAVRQGAGLMMLGGRNSFGDGGWAGTDIAEILPVDIHPGDGQIEPPNGGLKVIPNPLGLDSYVLRIGPDRSASAALWDSLPPLAGINRLQPKIAARLWAVTPQGDPVVAALEFGRGRSLAFAGETWPWYRASDQARLGHLNFWRNAILWLAHKEDEGENQVRLELDRRRVALGQKLDLTASARDPKGQPLTGVEYRATITRLAPDAEPATIPLTPTVDAARGAFLATGEPGEYRAEVTATRDGETIGSASARFLVYDDDRELRRTAADLTLLESLAQASNGLFITPEQLNDTLKKLPDELVADYETQREIRLWDNWPFLLLFTTLISAEWFLRKRHGWP
ncbi:MAG: membrane protein [Isosphaeraceae bacterium]|nr:MAG: membrane protein [Isosphaeraceae bacterium]